MAPGDLRTVHVRHALRYLRACGPARSWLMEWPGDGDPARAYARCDHGLWLAWLAGALWRFGGVTRADVLLSSAAVLDALLSAGPVGLRDLAEPAVRFVRSAAEGGPGERADEALAGLVLFHRGDPAANAVRALAGMARVEVGYSASCLAEDFGVHAALAESDLRLVRGAGVDGRELADAVRGVLDFDRLMAGLALAHAAAELAQGATSASEPGRRALGGGA